MAARDGSAVLLLSLESELIERAAIVPRVVDARRKFGNSARCLPLSKELRVLKDAFCSS